MDSADDIYRLTTRLPASFVPSIASRVTQLKAELGALFRRTLTTDNGLKAFAATAAEAGVHVDLTEATKGTNEISEQDQKEARVQLLNEALKSLGRPIDQPFMEVYFARLYRAQFKDSIAAFSRAFDAASEGSRGQGTILFVARNCFDIVWREAWTLKQRGFRTFLISLGSIPQNKTDLFFTCFDAIYQNCNNYVVLDLLLEQVNPDVLHVQCAMWEYLMARFVFERKRTAKVICEFYDVTGIYARRNAYLANWLPALIDLELDCEREIFQKSDGIVHRFREDIFAAHGQSYGRVPPFAEIQQFPLPHLIKSEPAKETGSGQIRCVYIGSIAPYNKRHPKALYPIRSIAETWEVLLTADISVTVYYTPFGSADAPGFEFLKDLEDKFPHFSVRPALPPHKLAAGIADYDFGLNVWDPNLEISLCRPELFKGAVGAKLYQYFEAGLPVVVNTAFEYASSIIENNGLGVSVTSAQIPTLPQKLKSADALQMRKNVARFSEKNTMDRKISKLIELYGLPSNSVTPPTILTS